MVIWLGLLPSPSTVHVVYEWPPSKTMIHAHSIENMFFYRCTNVQPAAAQDASVGAYFNILVPTDTQFYWKLLRIGIQSAKDPKKMTWFSNFEGPPLPRLLCLYLRYFYAKQRQVDKDFLDAVYLLSSSLVRFVKIS